MELEPDQQIGRFRVVRKLGSGGQGQTFEAEDPELGSRVAIKALSMESVAEWKAVELFEREARVLSGIDHPNIPAYVDYVAEGDSFFLVQELIDGVSLEDAVADGFHADTDEVRRIAKTLLRVLVYLHELHPPVIHRDIKPRNVLRSDDGRVTLVDFGAVRDAAQVDTYASTMVGTYGYMAPEQYHGEADERSDLYGLGATLVFLLTGEQPSGWPRKRLKIDVASMVSLPDDFASWLDRLIEPAPEDRFPNARAALAAMDEPAPAPRVEPRRAPSVPAPSEPPQGSRIQMKRAGSRLEIDIPADPSRAFSVSNLFMVVFSTFWLGFVAFWTLGAAAGGGLFALFSIPFWLVGFFMGFNSLRVMFGGESIELDGAKLRAVYRVFTIPWSGVAPRAPVGNVEIREKSNAMRGKGQAPPKAVAVDAGIKTHWFGLHLSDPEKAWLAETLDRHVRRAHASEVVLDLEEEEDEVSVSEEQNQEQSVW